MLIYPWEVWQKCCLDQVLNESKYGNLFPQFPCPMTTHISFSYIFFKDFKFILLVFFFVCLFVLFLLIFSFVFVSSSYFFSIITYNWFTCSQICFSFIFIIIVCLDFVFKDISSCLLLISFCFFFCFLKYIYIYALAI